MSKQADSDPSLSDYVGVLKRRGRLFTVILAGVVLAGVALAYRVPPQYSSRGVMLAELPGVSERAVRSTVPSYPEERVRIITQRVLTRDNLQRIIEENGLYPELGDMPAEARSKFRDHLSLSAEDPEILESIMGTTRPAGALAFSVAFLDPSPTVARDVASDLVELYLAENHEARREQAAETTRFLREEVARLESAIAGREAKIADFKTENAGRLPELSGSNLQMLDRTERDLDAVEQEIRTLRERQALYTSELEQLSPQATVLNDQGAAILSPSDRLKMLQRSYMQLSAAYSSDHPDVLKVRREIEALSASTGLPAFDRATLQSELVARRDELAAARDRYSADHPDVLRLERTVQSITEALAAAPANSARALQFAPDNPAYIQREAQLRGVNIDLNAAIQRRDRLRTRLDDLESRLTTSPEVEREYSSLNRGYEQLLDQFSETQTKLHEAEMSLNLEQDSAAERFNVLEQPVIASRPAKPNRMAVLLLTMALGFALATAGVALAERSDATVRSPNDVTAYLEIPPLVAIPYVANPLDVRRRARRRVFGAVAVCLWVCSIVFLIVTPA